MALLTISLLLLGSCEGEPGRDGVNLIGEHPVTPSIELVQPLPPLEAYGAVFIEALSNDNDIITQVDFLVNGSDVVASLTAPPWNFPLNLRDSYDFGTHSIQAIATDIYDRKALSSVIYFQRMLFSQRPEKDTLRYFVDQTDPIYWSLPDPEGIIMGFGVRFSPDFYPVSDNFTVATIRTRIAILDGDTTTYEPGDSLFNIDIWTVRDGLPDSLLFSGAQFVPRDGIPPTGNYVSQSITFGGGKGLILAKEYIVTLSARPEAPSDTILFATDEGQWRNGHSLVNENGVWREFNSGPYTAYNPNIYTLNTYKDEIEP
ncbi:Ig-like domain-containing protein [Calditrichota bacterium]